MVMGGDCLVLCSSTPENYQSLTPGLPVRFIFLMPLGKLPSANRSSSDLKSAIQRRSSFWMFIRNLIHGNQKRLFDILRGASAGAGRRHAGLCCAPLYPLPPSQRTLPSHRVESGAQGLLRFHASPERGD